MNLLLVGDANSIFFVEYVKALKKIMNIKVFVYSPEPDKKLYAEYPYDKVYFDCFSQNKLTKIKFFGAILSPFLLYRNFRKFIKKTNNKFDIIHVHWLRAAWVIEPVLFKRFSNKFFVTFWGGELEKMELLHSHDFYLKRLGKFLKCADYCVGSPAFLNGRLLKLYPSIKDKCCYGYYGSSIIELLSNKKTTRKEAKMLLNIPPSKVTVLLGYSGKKIHRHLDLLNYISANESFNKYKDTIHFVLPMTRGASNSYIEEIESKLKEIGCTFTMIKNTYQTDDDVATLRIATDIAFQVTEFDGLSNSIKEILCAGTILISGDWYPTYSTLKEDGFHYLEVNSVHEAVETFYNVLPDFDSYKISFEANKNVAKTKYSWSECIKPWAALYNKCNK